MVVNQLTFNKLNRTLSQKAELITEFSSLDEPENKNDKEFAFCCQVILNPYYY